MHGKNLSKHTANLGHTSQTTDEYNNWQPKFGLSEGVVVSSLLPGAPYTLDVRTEVNIGGF
jgi:hypothetical protein